MSTAPQKQTIFVYGTLKRGFGNYEGYLAGNNGVEFVGEAQTKPEFSMLHLGGFPGIVRKGKTAIKGEVFKVDRGTMLSLDRLEGHPHFYQRSDVTLADGTQAITYILPNEWYDKAAVIESGEWGGRAKR